MKLLLTFAILLGNFSLLQATAISNPLIYGNPGVSASFSIPPGGPFALSATTCFVAFCPGEGAPGPGPVYVVSDPLTSRIARFVSVCIVDSCLGYGFNSNSNFVLPVAGSADVMLHVHGIGPPNNNSLTTGVLIVIDGVNGIATPQLPLSTDSLGNFGLDLDLGTVSWAAGANVLIDPNLFTGSTTFGQRFTLTSPYDVVLTIVATPEPATSLAVGSALLLLLLARRRI